MAGALSKDTDQTLTRYIEKDTGAKFIYIPFRSGGEASVQLTGGHVQLPRQQPERERRPLEGGASEAALRLLQGADAAGRRR